MFKEGKDDQFHCQRNANLDITSLYSSNRKMLSAIEDMEKQQILLPVRGPVGKTTLESNMTELEKSKMHIAHILAVLLLELSPKDSCRRR